MIGCITFFIIVFLGASVYISNEQDRINHKRRMETREKILDIEARIIKLEEKK